LNVSCQISNGISRHGGVWQSENLSKLIAVAGIIAIAAVDLWLPQVSVAILFSVPLVILAGRNAKTQHIWWYIAFFVAVTYGIYFAKYLLVHSDDAALVWSFRLFNRTFLAITLALLGIAAQAWLYWQHERSLLTYLDQADEDEVNATAGFVGCIGLALIVTAIDFVMPANFNLSILFAVPLYLVSWLRNRRLIWLTAIVLVGLTWFGYVVTPRPTVPGVEFYTMINRSIVTSAILLLAGVLSWHVPSERPSAMSAG
jgi:hypothetical protein